MTHEQYKKQNSHKKTNGQQPDNREPQAVMWGKRTRYGFYYSIRLADGSWINLKENPFKRAGDKKPDFIQFEFEPAENHNAT